MLKGFEKYHLHKLIYWNWFILIQENNAAYKTYFFLRMLRKISYYN